MTRRTRPYTARAIVPRTKSGEQLLLDVNIVRQPGTTPYCATAVLGIQSPARAVSRRVRPLAPDCDWKNTAERSRIRGTQNAIVAPTTRPRLPFGSDETGSFQKCLFLCSASITKAASNPVPDSGGHAVGFCAPAPNQAALQRPKE